MGLKFKDRLTGSLASGSLIRLQSRCHLVPQLHQGSTEEESASKLTVLVGWIQFLMDYWNECLRSLLAFGQRVPSVPGCVQLSNVETWFIKASKRLC